jgi:hypothetical protein
VSGCRSVSLAKIAPTLGDSPLWLCVACGRCLLLGRVIVPSGYFVASVGVLRPFRVLSGFELPCAVGWLAIVRAPCVSQGIRKAPQARGLLVGRVSLCVSSVAPPSSLGSLWLPQKLQGFRE